MRFKFSSMFAFKIHKKSKKSRARVGEIVTPHGKIKTPAFIPVATLGVIKAGLSAQETEQSKVQCQITNTFHFLDLDRVNQIKKAHGLHGFFNFDKPIFTDSGGFQVFSLGKGSELGLGKIGSIFPKEGKTERKKGKNLLKIGSAGARFKSPRDGREILLTPELSYKVQKSLGADFIYLLDVCGTPLDDHNTAEKEMELSHKWFERFLKEYCKHEIDSRSPIGVGDRFRGNDASFCHPREHSFCHPRAGGDPEPSPQRQCQQAVFGIVQGGVYKDLRQQSTQFVNNLDVFGIAIGGALGNSKKEMYKIISWVQDVADSARPRHLLGIGDLDVLEKIIEQGIDLFDCALPTRIARHGTAMTSKGNVNMVSGKHKNNFKPIEKGCGCPTCQKYSIAQINFLFRAKEQLAGKLLTMHNLFFLETQLEKIRQKIANNKL